MKNVSCRVQSYWVLVIVVPIPAFAGVSIGIGISLPPPITFGGPPEVIVLPDTNDVYVAPDIDAASA